MLKVFIPTDLSQGAANALRYSLLLTRDLDAEIILFNGNMIPIPMAEMPVMTDLPERDELIVRMKEETEPIVSSLKGGSTKISYEVSAGLSLESCVEDTAIAAGADLIVMGTHGASGIRKVLLGSNTVRMIETTRLPVLVVPQDYNFVQPTNILMPSDLKFLEQELSDAVPFAKLMGATLEVLFFSDATDKAAKSFDAATAIVASNGYEKIKLSLESIQFGKTIAEDIGIAVNKRKPEMIIMFRHRHNWLGNFFLTSQTDQVAFATKIPLLAFHEPGGNSPS